MASYTATSWTIAYPTATDKMNGRYADTEIRGRKRYVQLKLTLPQGGEVPAGGVPLPTYDKIGMVRYVDEYILKTAITTNFTTARAHSYHWSMNTTGKKLVVHRYTLASSTVAGSSGGRAIRSATVANLTLSGNNTFYVTAVGF